MWITFFFFFLKKLIIILKQICPTFQISLEPNWSVPPIAQLNGRMHCYVKNTQYIWKNREKQNQPRQKG